jgi:hypothetical protein
VRLIPLAIVSLTLAGCASDQPWITVSTYSVSARWMAQCGTLNSPYRATDRECRVINEPQTQPGMVQKIERLGSPGLTWRERTDILIWCRERNDNTSPGCEGIPPIRPLVKCGQNCG